jgi:hypothetical protein
LVRRDPPSAVTDRPLGHRGRLERVPTGPVLGVDAAGAGHDALHDPQVTRDYYDAMPDDVRRHLHCRVVARLELIVQKYQIEDLAMGAPRLVRRRVNGFVRPLEV